MKKVFSSPSLWEAREILTLLEQQRIPATLINEQAATTPGVLPFNLNMTVDAEVWVLDAALSERCERLIHEFLDAAPEPAGDTGGHWRCAGCSEENPASFDLCWSCGQAR